MPANLICARFGRSFPPHMRESPRVEVFVDCLAGLRVRSPDVEALVLRRPGRQATTAPRRHRRRLTRLHRRPRGNSKAIRAQSSCCWIPLTCGPRLLRRQRNRRTLTEAAQCHAFMEACRDALGCAFDPRAKARIAAALASAHRPSARPLVSACPHLQPGGLSWRGIDSLTPTTPLHPSS